MSSFDFVQENFYIGQKSPDLSPQFIFYKRGFRLGGSSGSDWQDIILSGNTALTLVNAKADSLEYLKLFGDTEQLPETYLDTVTLSGGCEQTGTPTPTTPIDIVCNNGAIKVSPNLLNMANANIHTGFVNSTVGQSINWLPSSVTNTIVDAVNIKVGETYTFSSFNNISGNLLLCIVNNGILRQKMEYSITANRRTSVSITATADGQLYIQYVIAGQDFQLEQGSTVTTYMPYGQIYTQGTVETVTDSNGLTANAERLLAVGDYKDTQEVISGSVTRRVGIKVLNGTEDWSMSGTSFRFDGDVSYAQPNTCLCTHFEGWLSSDSITAMPDLSIKTGHPTFTYRVYLRCDRFTTVEQLTSWLAEQYTNGNPVIIVYPTSSATTETVTPQLLQKSPVTQTAGSISNLPIVITESEKTTPTPTQPLPINCNNGVVKVSPNLFNEDWEQGAISGTPDKTYEETKTALTTRIRVVNEIYLDHTKTYTISINNPDLEFVIQVFNSQHRLYTITDVSNVWGTSPKTFTGAYGVVVALRYKTQVDILPTEGQNAKVQLELGSVATSYMPYGIYTDGTTETVEITGKNLYNPATRVNGYYISANGTLTAYATSCYSALIPVKPNTQYIFSGRQTVGFSNKRVHAYDSNGTWMQQLNSFDGATATNYTVSFTTTSSTAYVRISLLIADADVQVELGSTATTYEPYFDGGTATAENLFKVGTYQDVQSVIDGGVTKQIGIKVFDGTENWTYDSQYSRFSLDENIGVVNTSVPRSIPAYCTHYGIDSSQTPIGNLPDNTGYIGSVSGGVQYSKFWVHTSAYNDATNYKAFLASEYQAGHPVILVYPLATPTTETVTGQPLTIQEGTNIVQITQASMDDLELEVKYKAGVSVTVEEIETAQLDDNVEITIS